MAAIRALALFVIAIYPVAAEATMISKDTPRTTRVSRDPFLFQPALSRVGLNADACGLASRQAAAGYYSKIGGQASLGAQYGAGMSNVTFPSLGRLFRDGGSWFGYEQREGNPSWDAMVWEPSGLSSDARLPANALPDLGGIETRVANIGNCLNYMQYLLKSIGVIFSLPQGNFGLEPGRNVVNNPYAFIFMATRKSVANASDSAAVASRTFSAPKSYIPSRAEAGSKFTPKYVPNLKLNNTLTTLLDENRSRLTRNSSGRRSVSVSRSSRSEPPSFEQREPRRFEGIRNIVKNFAIDIFSQVYTYILAFGILVFALLLRSRV